MDTETAQQHWAETNANGYNNIEQLKAALVEFDGGDSVSADLDIEDFNFNAGCDGRKHRLTRRSWRAGIVDAIELMG